ncbi:MAG: ComEC/Rec2 family competence protein [Bacteroidales bacterium]
MLRREIPFLRVVPFLCGGIICDHYFQITASILIAISAFTITGLAVSLLVKSLFRNRLFGIFFTSAIFITGLWLPRAAMSVNIHPTGKDRVFVATVEDYPDEKEKTWMIPAILNGTDRGGRVVTLKAGILLYIQKDGPRPVLKPGDRISLSCQLSEIRNMGNPDEFNYRSFMNSRGYFYTSFIRSSDLQLVDETHRSRLKYSALHTREKIIDQFREKGFEGRKLALTAALLLGQKTLLEPDQKQVFITAGVMHVMAVSGLHTGILSFFIFSILFFLRGRLTIVRVLITVIFLWSFAYVTGLTPSVLRATLMFTFLHTGNLLRRPVNNVNSVLASAFILILGNPFVIFDAGFQLSYLAVLFIIIFYDKLYSCLSIRNPIVDFIWKSVCITLVAQAGTMALSITLFNRFPTWFLLSNLFIVPASSMAIIAGCVVVLTWPVSFLSSFFAFLTGQLINLTDWLTATAAALPGASISNLGMTFPECILLTVATGLTINSLLDKESRKTTLAFSLFLIVSISSLSRSVSVSRSSELIVYNTPGYSTIGIRTGRNMILYTDSPVPPTPVTRHASASGFRVRVTPLPDQSFVIRTGKQVIYIGNGITPARVEDASTAIITGKGYVQTQRLMKQFPAAMNLVLTRGHVADVKAESGTSHPGYNVSVISLTGSWLQRLDGYDQEIH